MADKKKKEGIVKKFRIVLLGPSFVGKTQIVNRFINNSFSSYYEPTVECQIYRRAYNVNEEEFDEVPKFFDLEIWDLFPHDHPWLDQDKNLMDDKQKVMADKLDQVIGELYKEKKKKKDTDKGQGEEGKEETGEGEEKKTEEEVKEKLLIDKVHAFVFIYDASNKRTFESLMCMFTVIMELEKNFKKGAPPKAGQLPKYLPKKVVVGNKKDLMKNRKAGIITEEDIQNLDGIQIKEVSALTNNGISSVFKKLVTELDADITLTKNNETYLKELEKVMAGEKEKGEEAKGEEAKEGGPTTIVKEDAKPEKGGFWASLGCGPRGEDSTDSDKVKEESSEDEDANKVVGEDEDKEPPFIVLEKSKDQLAQEKKFMEDYCNDGDNVEEEDGACQIF